MDMEKTVRKFKTTSVWRSFAINVIKIIVLAVSHQLLDVAGLFWNDYNNNSLV